MISNLHLNDQFCNLSDRWGPNQPGIGDVPGLAVKITVGVPKNILRSKIYFTRRIFYIALDIFGAPKVLLTLKRAHKSQKEPWPHLQGSDWRKYKMQN